MATQIDVKGTSETTLPTKVVYEVEKKRHVYRIIVRWSTTHRNYGVWVQKRKFWMTTWKAAKLAGCSTSLGEADRIADAIIVALEL